MTLKENILIISWNCVYCKRKSQKGICLDRSNVKHTYTI